ncbi:MAG: hypothetical protein OYM47_15795 [Gemmatimonadota bacterium]|nr:hypothetical protein [Gemmatimonadota bacterium]
MLRFILALCMSVCLAAISVSAQQKESASGAEIGTLFGLSHLSDNGEDVTLIGLPSASLLYIYQNPSIYVSWFSNERLAFGPEFSLGRFSVEGHSITSLFLSGRTAFHSGSVSTSGAYVFCRGALLLSIDNRSGESESDTDVSVGAGLGYCWPLASGLVVRAEGGYRRWFEDPGVNEFSLLLGLGARAGHASAVEDSRSTRAEIGTLFGLSQLSIDGDGLTLIGIPLAPLPGITQNLYPSIYVSWFPDDRFSIRPEFGLGRASVDGESITSLYLAGQTGFHSGDVAASGAYVFGHGAIRVISAGESESDTDVGAGAGLGYRWRARSGLVVRAECRYRRWFDDPGTNEFSLLLGLGASIGGS